MKTCRKCGESKRKDQFAKQKSAGDGLQNKCKSCQKAYRQANRDKLKSYLKNYHRKKKYGVDQDGVDAMLDEQGGCCAICGTTEPSPWWCVDHNHKTMDVRGVLCHPCNSAIGLLKDDPRIMMAAASYVLDKGSYSDN